jgi:hypothetical protein
MPVSEVADDLIGQLVDGEAVDAAAIEVRLTVVAGAHDDVHAGRLGDTAQSERVAPQPFARDVHDRAAAGLAERGHLADRERLVVQQPVTAVLAEQVDEEVLVRQRDAEVGGVHRPGDGHDGRHSASGYALAGDPIEPRHRLFAHCIEFIQ